MATKKQKAAAEAAAAVEAEESLANIMLVHKGDDMPFNWEDLNFKGIEGDVTPATVSDNDLLAALEDAAGLKAGDLGNTTIKRPATGRILVSSRSVLG